MTRQGPWREKPWREAGVIHGLFSRVVNRSVGTHRQSSFTFTQSIMRLETFISLRYFFSRREEAAVSFITGVAMVGVALGVAALVVAMAVMNGYQANLVAAMSGALPHVTLHPLIKGGTPPVESVPEILGPQAVVTGLTRLRMEEALLQGPATTGSKVQGVMLRGIDSRAESNAPEFAALFQDGSPNWSALSPQERQTRVRALMEHLDVPAAPDQMPVLISRVLSERLGAKSGDTLNLLRIPKKGGGFSPEPLAVHLRIVGLFNTGIMAFDELVAITHVDHLKTLFPNSGGTESVGIRLKDPMRAVDVAAYVRANSTDEGRGFYVYSWLETNRGLFQVILVQKAMLFLVLLLIVIIAFFGMISALVMLVVEKTKEISVLKALGMRDRSVYRMFLTQGLLIGLVGSLAGLALGLGICWLLDTFPLFEIPPGVYPGSDRVPVRLSVRDLGLVLGATWLACLVATLFPARKATALSPVEGLRRG